MSNNITLSAGVRQNLLSLQSTADLMSLTQNRLATGKKVNSALDNPSNFFTSQALGDRASDLNALLDSIGQAQKTLEATDKGLTSLTKLVESAKSIAKQARQAAQPTNAYAAVNVNADISAAANLNGDEVIGTHTGNNTSIPGGANFSAVAIAKTATIDTETLGTSGNGAAIAVANSTLYSFTVNINGAGAQTVSFTSDASATYAEIRDGLISSFATAATASGVTAGTDIELVANGAGDGIRVNALQADVDFAIGAGAGNSGLTAATYNSTSLLDNLVAAGGADGDTFSVTVNGGSAQTITIGAGGGEVSTIAELNTSLQALTGGVTASAAGGAGGLSFSLTAGATNTLTLAASNTAVRNVLGFDTARTAGQGGGFGTTSVDLSRTFNSAATLADTDPTNLLNGGNLTITVNGSAQTVGFDGDDRLSDIIGKLQGNATLNNNLTFAETGTGELSITAKNADVDFAITGNNVATAIGLTAGSYDSTSLLDRLNTKLGGGTAGQGTTLTIQGNGGQITTLTFGTGSSEISTKAELTTALASVSGGVTASLTGTSLSFQVGANSSATSLTFGGTAAAALGFTAGTTSGAVSSTTNNGTRAALQTDYNDVLTQIDTLAKDASYNGINLLNGDNLKVVFNEKGTSTLTIAGVTFGSSGLGLSSVSGTAFQSDATIDLTITSLDGALSSLRTQASKFGSSLTTVQTRQDFTKQLINTLQTGADALVLADSNEEGANLLALQTRQQLSSTALSLSAQADQAVLRLFG